MTLNPRLTQDVADALSLDWSAESLAKVPVPLDKTYTPAEIEALLKRGIDLHVRGFTKQAMEIYREVLLHDRTNKRALYFASIALSQENAPEEQVLAIMQHAVSEAENVPEAQYNLGILFHRMGRAADARARFEKAVALMPKLAEAKTSLAGCLLNEGSKEEGRAMLRSAAATITAQPDSVYSRAFAKLTLGDLYGGWTDYDSRWQTASFLVENRRDFGSARHWNGKPMPGKVLYVHTEQGAGDVIMFSRFLKRVKEKSQATVILEVGESVLPFLAQLEGIDYAIPSNSPSPLKPDAFLPYMGMMRKCGLFAFDKIPSAGGWLYPVKGHEAPLPTSGAGKLKVGITWAGSKAHKNDRYRSIMWDQFRDVLLADDHFTNTVEWYSLQVGDRSRDVDGTQSKCQVIDLTPSLKTFAETAHACQQLDLIIACDTATVHAACALVQGPPVWMLTPAAPDWRWLLDGETTPWYSRLTMLRQHRADDWETPLNAAANKLAAHLMGPR